MNRVQEASALSELINAVRTLYPLAHITLDEPDTFGGSVWIDVRHLDRHIAIEHRTNRGFGVSIVQSADGKEDTFSGADYLYAALQDVIAKVTELFSNNG